MADPASAFAPAKRRLPTAAIVGIVCGSLALLVVVAGAIVGFNIFTGVKRFQVPGTSMEPTIQAGETITATVVDSGEYEPKHGDIVVFNAPDTWASKPGEQQIKRVIALPGERVACCDPQGQMQLAGKPLIEPYVKPGSNLRVSYDITVPEGRLWLLGDNRSQSGDSLNHYQMTQDVTESTIPLSAIVAIVKR